MFKCLLCKSLDYHKLFEFNNMPASAQDIPTKEELPYEKGENLEMVQCKKCGLVQFNCQPVGYYKDVIRAGGATSTMRNLRMEQLKDFFDRFNLYGKKIIEVGCGRGDFLQYLKEFDVEHFGIENNPKLVLQAKEKGLNVIQAFADGNLGKLEQGPFAAFLSFNFLEHQPDPNSMLQDIYNNLAEDGVGLVTVPSLEYILENDGYYEFIKDHIAYYSFDTLTLLFNLNGFEVLKREIVNRDTLSIYVKKRKPVLFENIIKNSENLETSINTLLKQNAKKKIALWGASHQGFTLAATLHLENRIEYVIDSSEFKQGKYSPAAHIPIVDPDYFFKNPVDIIIIVAPGYTEEIYKVIKEKYNTNIDVYCLKSKELEMLK